MTPSRAPCKLFLHFFFLKISLDKTAPFLYSLNIERTASQSIRGAGECYTPHLPKCDNKFISGPRSLRIPTLQRKAPLSIARLAGLLALVNSFFYSFSFSSLISRNTSERSSYSAPPACICSAVSEKYVSFSIG